MNVELSDIIIDPEFQGLIPPLTAQERADLEASLKADGCIAPLVVWVDHNILLDGHNRFEFCRKHDIECEIHEIVLDSREAAKAWVIKHQLGRRNLTESQRAMLATVLADIYSVGAKARQEASRARPGQQIGDKARANLPAPGEPRPRDQAAADMNVSPRLVQAAKKVKEEGTEELQSAVRAGEVSVSAAAEIARLPREDQERIVAGGKEEVARVARAARRARRKRRGGISPHALTPVRGHSDPPAMVGLSLPKANPVLAANTLIDLFETDWLRALVERIANHLKSLNAAEGDNA
jgi:hypothetical protein